MTAFGAMRAAALSARALHLSCLLTEHIQPSSNVLERVTT